MKIVVAPDSFKGSLSAQEVCYSIEKGIKKADCSIEVVSCPMADGGEGTTEALVKATGGQTIPVLVHDPLMREISSFIGVLGDEKTAVVEMAAASGLTLIKEAERNPMLTTTYGTGELIRAALDMGYRNILIGVGGSATNDGGMGMAMALGVRFLDQNNLDLPHGGGNLSKLKTIDISKLDSRISECTITAICDVDNPLCGLSGASYIFSPQKGADKAMVKILDSNLLHYGKIVEKITYVSIIDIPGSGAAGGLSAGLLAFLNAKLRKGVDIIIEASGLEKLLADADYVITGEGMIDAQTSHGKTPFGVASLSSKYNIPVIAFAGAIAPGFHALSNNGFTALFSITNGPISLSESMENCSCLLETLALNITRLLISKALK